MTTLNFFITTTVLLLATSGTTTTSSPDEVNVLEFWYAQPLDHFVFGGEQSSQTFHQRVFIDKSYRGGRANQDGMPIFVFIGGESSIEVFLGGGGILTLAALRFHAIVVYVEHRFYGQSVPLGSIDSAMMDSYVRGCLTSQQALADLAEVIRSLKSEWSIPKSPVIVFGSSYAGMLAAWFRIKYPHLAIGALASSAPLLSSVSLPLENQYCTIVSRDFEIVNQRCYDYISKSWRLIDEIASQPGGLDTLSKTFHTCSPLLTTYELKIYLVNLYNYVAQYNGRFGEISRLCKDIANASEDDILGGIANGIMALAQVQACNNITDPSQFSKLDSASLKAWDWQVCSELVPRRGCSELTMFENNPFNLTNFTELCFEKYGEYPRPNWISTYYGGQDIKSTLKTSASNIMFSNGLLDPYSGASILQDESKTVVAITTKQGSHSMDLNTVQDDDPKWLKHQRRKELKVIAHWIKISKSSSNWLQISAISRTLLVIVVYFLVC